MAEFLVNVKNYVRCDSASYSIKVNRITWAKWNHAYETTAATTTGQYYTNAGSDMTCASSTVWNDWNNTYYQPVTTSIRIENNQVWEQWIVCKDGLSMRPVHRALTEEERAAREARLAEGRRQQAEAAAAAKAASERGLALLLSALDDEQAAEYQEHRQFHVTTRSGRRYCIKHGRQHNVFLVDAEGRAVTEYCGHVSESVPNEDNILAQKLALEHDEEEFLRVANAKHLARSRALV